MELSTKYNPQGIEDKWLKFWKEKNVFHAQADPAQKPFTMVIPPPNVTGLLHMGHALNNTLQDIMVRYKRMNGFSTLWMPGTDHAGIATQNVVEKELAKEGKTRQDLDREEFIERLWAWKKQYGDTIIHQLEKLGSSCDWERARFTMDEHYSEAVKEAFIRLYRKKLIYRGEYIINWCPRCQSALSDEEVEHKEKNGKLYHILYPFKNDPKEGVIVATTRPETMLGDTAVAVNPKDKRYLKLIGKTLVLPLLNREMKIIADDFVAAEFGTGAVKVTPAHDPSDFVMGQRHKLKFINILFPNGYINEHGKQFKGLERFEARKRIVADLEAQNLLVKIEDHKHAVGHCYRCDTIVEPYLSKQWFVKMKPLAQPALKAVRRGGIRIHPPHFSKVYMNWMENIRDWCISRQIWWGHRIPVWYDQDGKVYVAHNEEEAHQQARRPGKKYVALKQDQDVLDTWFSSWLWPFATLGWPEIQSTGAQEHRGTGKKLNDLEYFYPTDTLMTASEILFFWVARMIMAGYEFLGKKPFSDVFIHGTVRDASGRKMSKSLGNAIDPLEIINEYGADALRFSLINNCGQDIFISKEKFEIGRNFANKLWNASRLVFMNAQETIQKGDYDRLDIDHLDKPSRWVVARLHQTFHQVGLAIETFRYSEAENFIYEFFWGYFCDWYLELEKPKFNNEDVQKTALFVLKNSLKMMHPFIPFVTEEIYSYMHPKEQCLSVASWPGLDVDVDPQACEDIEIIIKLISVLRKIRIQWNVNLKDTVDVFIMPVNVHQQDLIKEHALDIRRMARLKNLTIGADASGMQDCATALVGQMKVFVPLKGVVDLSVEKKRMIDEMAQKQKLIDSLQLRLNNEVFLRKAPAEVMTKEKERLNSLSKEAAELKSVLANLLEAR